MTKITNELLEDYAMLYPRIECVKVKDSDGMKYPELMKPFRALKISEVSWNFEIILDYIQLRSIESITDEEFFELGFQNKEDLQDIYEGFYPFNQEEVDYLRSIGIATNFRGITVDELLESGKLKLI